jgi:hypothetical protein
MYLTLHGGLAMLEGARFRVVPYNPATALALAVTAAHGVRTIAGVPPWVTRGAFQLDGRPALPPAPEPPYLCCFHDGTTDGRYNYAARVDSTLLEPIGSRPLAPPTVYRFTLDWTSPEPVFPLAPAGLYAGIAYSARSDTFWLTRKINEGAVIEQWSRDGRHLATPLHLTTAFLSGIGVDPEDGTLWVVRVRGVSGVAHLENYATDGRALGTIQIEQPQLFAEPAGLEFAWMPAAN